MQLWAFWLIIGSILLITEMMTLTFYLLWLGVGAVAASAIAWFSPDSFVLQVLVGCLVALLLTLFTKPLTRRIRASGGYKDSIDDMVGKQGFVIEDIEQGKYGIVKVGNEMWSAISDEDLNKNDKVIVIRRSNTTVQVQKWGGIS